MLLSDSMSISNLLILSIMDAKVLILFILKQFNCCNSHISIVWRH